ncbi:g3846 [Coccomyxa elongata]
MACSTSGQEDATSVLHTLVADCGARLKPGRYTISVYKRTRYGAHRTRSSKEGAVQDPNSDGAKLNLLKDEISTLRGEVRGLSAEFTEAEQLLASKEAEAKDDQGMHGDSYMMEEVQRIRGNVEKLRITIRNICSMLGKIEVDFRAAQMQVFNRT